MRIFYGLILFFLLSLPFVIWYVRIGGKRVPSLFSIPISIGYIAIGYLLVAMFLYILVPTYREHIEPSITTITLMFLDGMPVYTTFKDPQVYSVFYGPNTYLLQALFLKFFSNPILGSKIYGVSCVLAGMAFLFFLISRKYGKRIAIYSLFYFSITVLLFAQVSFRNQSDSIIMLGNSLAASSVLLPAGWLSMLLLVGGSAISVNAKFHTLGYILPLLVFMYRQHGIYRLLIMVIATLILIFIPFLFKSFDIHNFFVLMEGYSKLPIHGWLFRNNLSMGFVIFLPLLFLIFVGVKKRALHPLWNDEFVTFLLTIIAFVAICFIAGIDGAGSYHLAPFAPTIAVLYAIFKSKNISSENEFVLSRGIRFRTLYVAIFFGWALTTFVFIVSVHRHYITFVEDNYSTDIENEMLKIRDVIARNHWSATVGYTDRKGYDYTFYRPLLWPVVKNDVLDPVAMMGREAVGLKIPDASFNEFYNQDFDVVVLPNTGEPFTMKNWHNPDILIFGNGFSKRFTQLYEPYIKYKYFVIWRAKRSLAKQN